MNTLPHHGDKFRLILVSTRGSILGRGKFFLFSIASREAFGPTHPLIQMGVGAFSAVVKGSGYEILALL
jgi:hypothetical protein